MKKKRYNMKTKKTYHNCSSKNEKENMTRKHFTTVVLNT